MAASRADSAVLASDPTFQNRVRESLVAACQAIAGEGFTVAFHRERSRFAAQVVEAPDSFKTTFAILCATDTNVLADATQAGTVVLTSGNVAAQAALVTDAHLDAAISAEFNTFIVEPG